MKISVTLRVTGDSLIPEEITSLLGVAPHLSRKKGDRRTSSSGTEIISKFGLWNWKSEDSSGTLTTDEHVSRLHSAFGHTHSALRKLPNATNAWIDICIVKDEVQVGDAAVEFTLNPNSIGILCEFGLPVEFTIY